MSHFRFNHVFLTLLLLSSLCAFIVPVRFSDYLRQRVSGIFTPVAYPLAMAAQRVVGHADPSGPFDPTHASADARAEIERLQTIVASLTAQLEQLQQLHRERDPLGDVQKYSLPVPVIGASTDSRQALTLAAGAGDGLAVGQPVIYGDGIVGKIASVGQGSTQVRLITDSGFRINAAFARYTGSQFARIPTDPPLVEGRGNGLLTITNLPLKQVQDAVQVGDWVVLNDEPDWDRIVQRYRLGRVEKIAPQKKMPLFAEIIVRPRLNLFQLREVLVFTGRPVAEKPR